MVGRCSPDVTEGLSLGGVRTTPPLPRPSHHPHADVRGHTPSRVLLPGEPRRRLSEATTRAGDRKLGRRLAENGLSPGLWSPDSTTDCDDVVMRLHLSLLVLQDGRVVMGRGGGRGGRREAV